MRIEHLPKEKWKGTILPIGYMAKEYYDVSVEHSQKGFLAELIRKTFDAPVAHMPEEYDFPDRLYADWWQKACAWGILEQGKLVAAIETQPEEWSNRLRVTELWVEDAHQRQGMGHALMEVAKEQARLERRRAVILETQSCNVNAVDFYLHEGFSLIGLDTCCYSNRDVERREVRMEMGWMPAPKRRLSRDEIEIRPERREEWHTVERMVQRAFWNKYSIGCDEHYLVHKLREHADYLPHLSRIAWKGEEAVGGIFYSRSRVRSQEKEWEVLTFGPLCVSPEWQGCGVGEMLLRETMEMAAKEGWPGIIIFGEPDYYPRMGFRTCDHFGITTADGKNFDAFMGIELQKGSMEGIHGSFHESEAFEGIRQDDVERYNELFPPLEKQYFPAQWQEG